MQDGRSTSIHGIGDKRRKWEKRNLKVSLPHQFPQEPLAFNRTCVHRCSCIYSIHMDNLLRWLLEVIQGVNTSVPASY